MKTQFHKVFLFFLAFLPLRDYAQLDTLVISNRGPENWDPAIAKTSLDTAHIFYVNFYSLTNSPALDKKGRRALSKTLNMLDKKLSEVKVVFILNPTGGLMQETDTNKCSIFKLHFEKMMSLQAIYIFGDDADSISFMPATFYRTPVKKMYCYNCFHPDRLKKEIIKKGKDIQLISEYIQFPDDKGMKLISRVFGL